MPKVHVLPGDSQLAAIKMFEKHGWEIDPEYNYTDLVCFLGGTDVNPLIYGAERHPMTQPSDTKRDAIECGVYDFCIAYNIPMVGICRGGQLLNVRNGGTMIQHLSCGLVSGVVKMRGKYNEPDIEVLVDHHQGMISGPTASDKLDRWYDTGKTSGPLPDYEIWYPETKSLSVQYHPEWGHKGTEDRFFSLLEECLGFKETGGA